MIIFIVTNETSSCTWSSSFSLSSSWDGLGQLEGFFLGLLRCLMCLIVLHHSSSCLRVDPMVGAFHSFLRNCAIHRQVCAVLSLIKQSSIEFFHELMIFAGGILHTLEFLQNLIQFFTIFIVRVTPSWNNFSLNFSTFSNISILFWWQLGFSDFYAQLWKWWLSVPFCNAEG